MLYSKDLAHVGGEYRTQVCIFKIKERAYNTFHKPFHHERSHHVKIKKRWAPRHSLKWPNLEQQTQKTLMPHLRNSHPFKLFTHFGTTVHVWIFKPASCSFDWWLYAWHNLFSCNQKCSSLYLLWVLQQPRFAGYTVTGISCVLTRHGALTNAHQGWWVTGTEVTHV